MFEPRAVDRASLVGTKTVMEEVEPREDTCDEMYDEKLLAWEDDRNVSERPLGGVKGLFYISEIDDLFLDTGKCIPADDVYNAAIKRNIFFHDSNIIPQTTEKPNWGSCAIRIIALSMRNNCLSTAAEVAVGIQTLDDASSGVAKVGGSEKLIGDLVEVLLCLVFCLAGKTCRERVIDWDEGGSASTSVNGELPADYCSPSSRSMRRCCIRKRRSRGRGFARSRTGCRSGSGTGTGC